MRYLGPTLLLCAALIAAFVLVPWDFLAVETDAHSEPIVSVPGESILTETEGEESAPPEPDDRPVVEHVPLPPQVKAIYMTSCVAGTPSFRQQLVRLAQETEINSIVIDIKDYSGTISFPPESEAWKPAWRDARCGTADMRELIGMLHDNGLFVIGRITVFQDPYHAPKHPGLAVQRRDGSVWTDHKGLSFIDVAAQPYWDHIIELAVESYNLGFDELNFDYVRYPSDGNMQDIAFPQSMAGAHGADKQANLEAFFAYLHDAMSDPERFAGVRHENTGRATATPWTSADLFGMTTTNYDDLSIGQIQERAAPYFDFIAPMVYPSHYPNSFLGLGDPNDHPYTVVHHAMKSGVERMRASTTPVQGFLHEPIYEENASGTPVFTGRYSKPVYGPERLRTWIQDFDYGGDYDAADVRAQIQASYDAGVMDWMIWAPSNIYTKAALLPPDTYEVATTSTSTP
jgi:hypothetical protein